MAFALSFVRLTLRSPADAPEIIIPVSAAFVTVGTARIAGAEILSAGCLLFGLLFVLTEIFR